MKNKSMLAALCVALLSAGAAHATGWISAPRNAMGAMMIPNGDMVMQIQLPADEFAAANAMMLAQHNACTMFNANPSDAKNSIIVICGANTMLHSKY